MANIFDMMEEYCAANNGSNAALQSAKGAVSWGIKNGLVTKPSPSKGTEYNWHLSRRIKRLEADKLKHQNRIKQILSR
jgi:hypothetical protein